MFIQKILTEHRNDFTATLECEHCGSTQHLGSGYHDNFYHVSVIPAIGCHACGKRRDGSVDSQNSRTLPHRRSTMKYAAALLLIAIVACTSQPVTTIGVGGVWDTQDHQAVGGHSGSAGTA